MKSDNLMIVLLNLLPEDKRKKVHMPRKKSILEQCLEGDEKFFQNKAAVKAALANYIKRNPKTLKKHLPDIVGLAFLKKNPKDTFAQNPYFVKFLLENPDILPTPILNSLLDTVQYRYETVVLHNNKQYVTDGERLVTDPDKVGEPDKRIGILALAAEKMFQRKENHIDSELHFLKNQVKNVNTPIEKLKQLSLLKTYLHNFVDLHLLFFAHRNSNWVIFDKVPIGVYLERQKNMFIKLIESLDTLPDADTSIELLIEMYNHTQDKFSNKYFKDKGQNNPVAEILLNTLVKKLSFFVDNINTDQESENTLRRRHQLIGALRALGPKGEAKAELAFEELIRTEFIHQYSKKGFKETTIDKAMNKVFELFKKINNNAKDIKVTSEQLATLSPLAQRFYHFAKKQNDLIFNEMIAKGLRLDKSNTRFTTSELGGPYASLFPPPKMDYANLVSLEKIVKKTPLEMYRNFRKTNNKEPSPKKEAQNMAELALIEFFEKQLEHHVKLNKHKSDYNPRFRDILEAELGLLNFLAFQANQKRGLFSSSSNTVIENLILEKKQGIEMELDKLRIPPANQLKHLKAQNHLFTKELQDLPKHLKSHFPEKALQKWLESKHQDKQASYWDKIEKREPKSNGPSRK